MTFAAGALSKTLIGQSFANLSSAAATGGTSPYTYAWYRSTTTGFTPGAGNILTGQTGLTLADSGLIPNTTYYYVVVATDTGNGNVTAQSAQLTVGTEPSLSQNNISQQQYVGVVDLRIGPTNVVSAFIDSSIGTGVAYNGQAVKLVASTAGGVPRVVPVTSKSDAVFGFIVFNIKDIQYGAGQACEVARWGTIQWLYATGVITQGAEVCVDPTYVGGVQATGNTATFVGQAYDGCSAAGLIKVQLYPNIANATA